ncbi:MAG: tyrosine-type recombinase/integrase [Methanoregula sp.]
MQELEKLKRLDPVNRTYFENYIRDLQLKNLKQSTVTSKLWRVYEFLIFVDFKDAKAATKEDLENYVLHGRNKCSEFTLQGDALELKLFYRWLVGKDQEQVLFEKIQLKKPKRKLPSDRLLTQTDIKQLVDDCDTTRDKALIMTLWDTGARVSEILNLNIDNIAFDQYGGTCVVSGKTGERRLRLIGCIPYLQQWINDHPMRDRPGSPLFITLNDRIGRGPRRLNIRTVQNRLTYLAKARQMTKPVHPHALRHARLTDLSKQGFSEMELRIMAGWENNSLMPAVYVHLSGADVEKKQLKNAGMLKEGEMGGEKILDPIVCPRCGMLNQKGYSMCARCNSPLTIEGIREIGIVQQLMSDPDDLIAYAQWRKRQTGTTGNEGA